MDDDEYLAPGLVSSLQELEAIRLHLRDIKRLMVFGIGMTVTAILIHKTI